MLKLLTLQPSAFALDISDFSVKIAALKKNHNGYRLATYGKYPLEKGLIEKGQIQKEDALAQSIKKAINKVSGSKVSASHVVTSLPEEQAFLKIIQLPKMSHEEALHAVSFEAENHVPYSVDTVYLDFQIVPNVDNSLDHLDVLLASLPRTTVDSYVSVLEKAGLVPKVLEIESLALSRALIKDEIAVHPVMIADIGTVHTKLSIFAGRSLRFATSVPISAGRFTESIASVLHIEKNQAEELKLTQGLERTGKGTDAQVFNALVPLMTDFVEQIKKYMDYYISHASHHHTTTKKSGIHTLILSGGGANLKGLPQFLTKQLQVETTLGNPWINIMPTPYVELPPLSLAESQSYSTVLGLALRAADWNPTLHTVEQNLP
jgi:type IV pilus assembly protein PilM